MLRHWLVCWAIYFFKSLLKHSFLDALKFDPSTAAFIQHGGSLLFSLPTSLCVLPRIWKQCFWFDETLIHALSAMMNIKACLCILSNFLGWTEKLANQMTATQRNDNKSAPRSNKAPVFWKVAGAWTAINVSSFERKDSPLWWWIPKALAWIGVFDALWLLLHRTAPYYWSSE